MIDPRVVVEAARELLLGQNDLEIAEVNRILVDVIPGWEGNERTYRQLTRWLRAPQQEAMSEIRALLLAIMAVSFVRTDPSSRQIGDWWLAEKRLRQLLKQARQQKLLHVPAQIFKNKDLEGGDLIEFVGEYSPSGWIIHPSNVRKVG
jgi:hypothetical protein